MSWLSRIFGSADREPTSLDIVSEYGSVLETAQRGWSGLFDMTDLPFEKTRIKKAILEVAAEFRDSPEQIKALGTGFVMLGSFQSLSNSPVQMAKPEALKAMDEEEFKRHVGSMVGRKDGDSSDRKFAIADSSDLESEWEAYLTSLGISDA